MRASGRGGEGQKNMTIKIYGDHLSPPNRAVLLFCRLNGIEFEDIRIDIFKLQQQFSPEYKAINPFSKIPTLVDENFKLFESHAILIYLASAFPGVADHWYPADFSKRAEIKSVLDWHHSNLRYCSEFVRHAAIFPAYGFPSSLRKASEAEKIVTKSLATIESFWLKENGRFLLGSLQPSIADLSLVCEIMAMEILDEKDRDRILRPHKKVLQWIEDIKNATQPHFDEVHAAQAEAKERFRNMRAARAMSKTEPGKKSELHSKM